MPLLGELALLVAGLLEETAELSVLGVFRIDLAILGALQRMIDDGDHVISIVARAGFLVWLLHVGSSLGLNWAVGRPTLQRGEVIEVPCN